MISFAHADLHIAVSDQASDIVICSAYSILRLEAEDPLPVVLHTDDASATGMFDDR
jgi:hypothetical protein